MAGEDWVDPSDMEAILRRKSKIEEDVNGATPNEVAHGLAEPTNITPNPDQPSAIDEQLAREKELASA